MEKLMTKNVLNKLGFLRVALIASVGFPLIFVSSAFAQDAAPPPEQGEVRAMPSAGQAGFGAAPSSAEVERVIVTGSNIPTAEETGPNPVDTYRQQDIQNLGVRNATDLLNKLP